MDYLHTMVRVTDLAQSLRFYCEGLGMREVRRQESEQGKFTLIFLAAAGDETQAREKNTPVIELTYNWPIDGKSEEYTGGRNFGHLAYRVKNIYEICQRLKDMGVVINRPPRDGYMAFVRSPDNISIEFLQAGESLAPAEPWVSMKNQGVW